MNKKNFYILNRMKFYLNRSEYEDNFIITNLDLNRVSYRDDITRHFANWFNDGNDDYVIMVNKSDNIRKLVSVGIDSDKILLRKDYTAMMNKKNVENMLEEDRDWMYMYLNEGKLILYDISDIRLFEHQRFYFGLSKLYRENVITRLVSYPSRETSIMKAFNRLLFISPTIDKNYYDIRKRILNIDKILST